MTSWKAHRGIWIAAGAAMVVAVAAVGGVAYATTLGGGGDVVTGCVQKASGQLRVVADPTNCLKTETAISWSQSARPTPGFEGLSFTPNEVEITAVGTGPLGFPTNDNPATPVVSVTLSQGVYWVKTLADVRKDSGGSIFSCFARDDKTGDLTAVVRTALGAEPGFARWTALNGFGFFNVGTGGATLTLECWQAADNAVPGTPTGENPTVFIGSIEAVAITSATITANGGAPINYP
jgi:hypothetical protein